MDDLPRTHRRSWRLWMDPSFAVDEWRELAILADELNEAADFVAGISRGLSAGMPGASGLGDVASKLRRLSYRWEKRSKQARNDAITDHKGDFEWVEARETTIREDLAVGAMGSALAALETAQRRLSGDDVAGRLRRLHEELERIYADVNGRNVDRRLRSEY